MFMNSTHKPIVNTHLSKALDILIKSVLVTILAAMTKYSRTETRKGFILSHGLRVQSLMVEKAWPQQHEVARHIASAGRKQRVVNPGARLPVLFIFSVTP